jgi:hypothetical protein
MDRSESTIDWGFVAPMAIGLLPMAFLFILPHLANWSPLEVILIGVLTAAALVVTGLQFWRRVSLAHAEAALKQAMLQRGLTPDEIERLLRVDSTPTQAPVPPLTDNQAIAELVGLLGAREVPTNEMEQILAAVMAVEPANRHVVCSSLLKFCEVSDGDSEKMLAVVRALTSGKAPIVNNRSEQFAAAARSCE